VSIRGGAVTSRGATIVSAKPHDSRLMPVWPATISRQQAALRHSLRCIAPTDLFSAPSKAPQHPRKRGVADLLHPADYSQCYQTADDKDRPGN
jgi:hypothetical protein